MKILLRIVLISIFVYVLVCLVWGGVITMLYNAHAPFQPMYSPEDSKKHGLYIYSIKVEPSSITWNGVELIPENAWVEHQSKLVFRFIIVPHLVEFPVYKKTDRYYVCIEVNHDVKMQLVKQNAFLVKKGSGVGFGSVGSVYIQESRGCFFHC